MFVGNQRDFLVVQEKAQVPRTANGYSGVVPTAAEIVVSLRDKIGKLADSNCHYRHLGCLARAGCTVQSVGGDSGRGSLRGSDTGRYNLGLGTGDS